jgi:septal ring factor EnvC (AmiA/AmiB activator)
MKKETEYKYYITIDRDNLTKLYDNKPSVWYTKIQEFIEWETPYEKHCSRPFNTKEDAERYLAQHQKPLNKIVAALNKLEKQRTELGIEAMKLGKEQDRIERLLEKNEDKDYKISDKINSQCDLLDNLGFSNPY